LVITLWFASKSYQHMANELVLPDRSARLAHGATALVNSRFGLQNSALGAPRRGEGF